MRRELSAEVQRSKIEMVGTFFDKDSGGAKVGRLMAAESQTKFRLFQVELFLVVWKVCFRKAAVLTILWCKVEQHGKYIIL